MDTSYINPAIFQNFLNFSLFMGWYQRFLGLFPPSTQWLVSAIVLFSIIAAFFVLIRTHWLFLILLIILLPVIYPVLQAFFAGIFDFVMFLWHSVIAGMPKTT